MVQSRTWGLIGLVVLLLIVYFSVFTVNPRELAIKFRLGEIVRTDYDPGLHFKIPFINNVRKFDARIYALDAEPESYLTEEKKILVVDSFIRWRINDIARYYAATGGSPELAGARLYQIVKDRLRAEFGMRTVDEVVSGDRAEIMDILTAVADKQAENFGIEVADVRLQRVDLPNEVNQSVFQRMEAERARVAKELRARGAEAAERIRADADRQRTVILSEAFGEAERVRGEGDGLAADIYASAYGNNQEFYSLYRTLNAYKNTFNDKRDIVVLEPDMDFFRYFKESTPSTQIASEEPLPAQIAPGPQPEQDSQAIQGSQDPQSPLGRQASQLPPIPAQ